MVGVGQDCVNHLNMLGTRAGEQCADRGGVHPCALADLLSDPPHLVWRLELAVDRLGVAAARAAVEVELGDVVVSHGAAPAA